MKGFLPFVEMHRQLMKGMLTLLAESTLAGLANMHICLKVHDSW
jgi:hypothetical protein